MKPAVLTKGRGIRGSYHSMQYVTHNINRTPPRQPREVRASDMFMIKMRLLLFDEVPSYVAMTALRSRSP